MKPRPAEPYWPKVLTDWCVIQALGKAGWPQRLGGHGELQAAFVSEVSWYLRFRALHLRELEAENLIFRTTESVYAEMGGSAYAAAKQQTEAAQSEFLSALGRSTRNSIGGSRSSENPSDSMSGCIYERRTSTLAGARSRPSPSVPRIKRQRHIGARSHPAASPKDFLRMRQWPVLSPRCADGSISGGPCFSIHCGASSVRPIHRMPDCFRPCRHSELTQRGPDRNLFSPLSSSSGGRRTPHGLDC